MKRILVCEDEDLIRKGICKIVESVCQDVQVQECDNGMEGYKAIAMWNPHVVITDIRMPVMDGLAMIEKAQADGARCSYVIISAYRDFEYARTAIRCGVREYLLKPLNRFEVAACLERLLDIKAEVRTANGSGKTEAADDGGSIGKAIQYIENNFYRSISLEEVSQAVHMNTAYFSTLFKKQTGKKYIDYVTDLRMEKARKLILNTEKNTLIGAALMSSYASEYIYSLALMIDLQVPVDRILRTVFPHPTVCEVVREALLS